ncbi:MAG: Uma2 family endonuclease [Fimbriimonas sp.]
MVSSNLMTAPEYLAMDDASEANHELIDGFPFQKSGVAPIHAQLAASIGALIHPALRGTSFDLFNSSLRVGLNENTFTHPDVMVVAGKVDLSPEWGNTATNPHTIFEVLSRTTEHHNRGRKAFLYMDVPSLQTLVLVASSAPTLETLERQSDGSWTIRRYEGRDKVVPLPSINANLPLADLYKGIEFPT